MAKPEGAPEDLLPSAGAEGGVVDGLPIVEAPVEVVPPIVGETPPEAPAEPATTPKKGRVGFPFFGRGKPKDGAAKDENKVRKEAEKAAKKTEKEAREAAEKAKRAELEEHFGNITKKETPEEKAAREKAEKEKKRAKEDFIGPKKPGVASRLLSKLRRGGPKKEVPDKKVEKDPSKLVVEEISRIGGLTPEQVRQEAEQKLSGIDVKNVTVEKLREHLEQAATFLLTSEGEGKGLLASVKGVIAGALAKFGRSKTGVPEEVVNKTVEELKDKRIFGVPVIGYLASVATGRHLKTQQFVAGAAAGFILRTAVRTVGGTVGIPIMATAGAIGGGGAGALKEYLKQRRERSSYKSFVEGAFSAGAISPEAFLKVREELKAEIASLDFVGPEKLDEKSRREKGDRRKREELRDKLRYLNVAFKKQSEGGEKTLAFRLDEYFKETNKDSIESAGSEDRGKLLAEIYSSKLSGRNEMLWAIGKGAGMGALGATAAGVWMDFAQASNINLVSMAQTFVQEHDINVPVIGGVGNTLSAVREHLPGATPGTPASGIVQPLTPGGLVGPEQPLIPETGVASEATPAVPEVGSSGGVAPSAPTGAGNIGGSEILAGDEMGPRIPRVPDGVGAGTGTPTSGEISSGIPIHDELGPRIPGGAGAADAVAGVQPPVEAAAGVVNISPEVAELKDTVDLPSGSNVWNESAKILKGLLGRDPTDAETLAGAKAIAKATKIAIPGWGLTEGTDQHLLRAGDPLNITPDVKKVFQQIVDGKLGVVEVHAPGVPSPETIIGVPKPLVGEIPTPPRPPVSEVLKPFPGPGISITEMSPTQIAKALPDEVPIFKGTTPLKTSFRLLEAALGQSPTNDEAMQFANALVKGTGAAAENVDLNAVATNDSVWHMGAGGREAIRQIMESPNTSLITAFKENATFGFPKGYDGAVFLKDFLRANLNLDISKPGFSKVLDVAITESSMSPEQKVSVLRTIATSGKIILPNDSSFKMTKRLLGAIIRYKLANKL